MAGLDVGGPVPPGPTGPAGVPGPAGGGPVPGLRSRHPPGPHAARLLSADCLPVGGHGAAGPRQLPLLPDAAPGRGQKIAGTLNCFAWH